MHPYQPLIPPLLKSKQKFLQQQAKVASFIHLIGDSPILRQKSTEVRPKDIDSGMFREKLGYLQSCFWKYRKATGLGRGMAAVQVGIPELFFVVLFKEEKELRVFINPKITDRAEERLLYSEMCMSAAPLLAPVVRPAWIAFDYLDEAGERQSWKMKADDLQGKIYNRIMQHEIDHLEGIINIDTVESRELTYAFDENQFIHLGFAKARREKLKFIRLGSRRARRAKVHVPEKP